jgi:hypothetical protein
MKQPYIPIPCAIHDRLLHFATLRQVVRIAYLPEGQADAAVTQGIIVDVFTQGGAEYLTLHDGLRIRLDQLIQVGESGLDDGMGC